jgi:hypothetical protein
MRTFFDQFSGNYAKFDTPSEHLVVVEVVMLFKGKVIFKPAVGNESLHEISNDDGVRVANFAI